VKITMKEKGDRKTNLIRKIDNGISARPLSSLEQSRSHFIKALELAHEKGDKKSIVEFQTSIELLDNLIDKKK
jgi:hypothetical protein